ncbi:MAG: hypothetical protein KGI27_08535 [Thaumarchaeota archaeon]|nr:hypothetical protein [Nitrososphaerota archaeon]
MRRHGFVERDIDPKDVYLHVKELLQSQEFKITSEDTKDGFWDIHAKKSNTARIIMGRVRDVDIVIAGTKGKFEVQLHAGIWGRDMAIPAIEGLATLGIAAAADVHSAHKFEEKLWEQIVNKIDSSLKICRLDGLLFKSDEELTEHQQVHQQQAQGSTMNQMLMMGMLGGGGMGMYGMGMGYGGFGYGGLGGLWI